MSNQFEGSLQHHDFFPGGHFTYPRCESCMVGFHFDEVTWHSWAGIDDTTTDVDRNAQIKTEKCACECSGAFTRKEK